jgi:hypothetical protein
LCLLSVLVCACQPLPVPDADRPRACDGLAVIRFSEHLCPGLRADTKRITLRARHRTAIRAGQWVQLVCMESRARFLARVTGVRHATWRTVTGRELTDDGFGDPHQMQTERKEGAQRRRGVGPSRAEGPAEQMLRIMRRYYPGIGWDDPATIYRWDRSRPCP